MNGMPVSVLTSSPWSAVCALYNAHMSVRGISVDGEVKYCVPMFGISLGSKGAWIHRRFSQTTPRKKGCYSSRTRFLMSSFLRDSLCQNAMSG